ncbi:MAG: nitroreductase family protein [Actinomycetota bacterium]|nr:nitroreductase family protein [Actinomycetota bacterium]
MIDPEPIMIGARKEISLEVLDAIFSRRSCRHFETRPIDEDVLKKVLKAGCSAPSAHNSQPWHFVVMGGKKKDDLSSLFLNVSSEARYKEYTGFYVNRLLKYSSRMIDEAPIVIAVFNRGSFAQEASKYFGRTKRGFLHMMEVQSVAAAIENLLIAAHSFGLGSVWLGVPLLIPEELVEDFFATKNELMAILPLGYPARGRMVEKAIDLEGRVTYLD